MSSITEHLKYIISECEDLMKSLPYGCQKDSIEKRLNAATILLEVWETDIVTNEVIVHTLSLKDYSSKEEGALTLDAHINMCGGTLIEVRDAGMYGQREIIFDAAGTVYKTFGYSSTRGVFTASFSEAKKL